MSDLMGFVNTIITHITNGNENEERLVNVMGGKIIETQTEIWMKQGMKQGMEQGMYQGKVQMIVELGQEDGLEDKDILNRLQEKMGVSLEDAKAYLQRYGKQLV